LLGETTEQLPGRRSEPACDFIVIRKAASIACLGDHLRCPSKARSGKPQSLHESS
jgi:hypothetical protein